MSIAKRRERERSARREAILDAAEPIVFRQGYDGLTMDEIAQAAELSKGTLYLYFENKDALCAAVASRHIRTTVLPELRRALAEAESGIERFQRGLEMYASHFAARPQLFRFVVSWLLDGDSSATDSEDFARYRKSLGEIWGLAVGAIEEGREDGTIREDLDPWLLAVDTWTSFLGVMLARVAGRALNDRLPRPVDMEEVMALHIRRHVESLRPRDQENSGS